MLTAATFFDLSSFGHPQLFADGAYVWTALNHLKGYMNDFAYTLPDSPLLPQGAPLTATVVLHGGRVLAADGLQIHYGDTTRGGLIVRDSGEILVGATVIMGGRSCSGRKSTSGREFWWRAGR